MISLVCVYNRRDVLEDCLLNSVRQQTAQPELLLTDNAGGRFASAAQALNHAAAEARGDYLLFVHQDVDLGPPSCLADAEQMMRSIPGLGIAGAAGARRSPRGGLEVVTNIRHGVPPRPTGNRRLEHPEEVQTIDECLVIVPRSVFGSLGFDEALRDGYHLYAVDYSLAVAGMGLGAWVLPISCWHRSRGTASRGSVGAVLSLGPYPDAYYATLARLLRKHRVITRWVYATTGRWSTTRPLVLQRVAALPRYLASRVLDRGSSLAGASKVYAQW